MPQITINTRGQLQALMRQKPKTVTEKVCPGPCQQKLYRVFIKGIEKWFGCKCKDIRPYHHF